MIEVEPDPVLLAGLVAAGRGLPGAAGAAPRVLASRDDVLVVRLGPVVVKAHDPATDVAELPWRLATAARADLAGVVLRPLAFGPGPVVEVEGRDGPRVVTGWPAGEPLGLDDLDARVWRRAGRMLARLHAAPLRPAARHRPPPAGGPRRLRRAVRRLLDLPGADPGTVAAVERAYLRLPDWARTGGGRARLTHGDWHLGQLARVDDRLLLLDLDDLGAGEPAWDLARPAAWFAVGVLPEADWGAFLDGYRELGGPAVPERGDPWGRLDVPARAAAVQTAAVEHVRAVRTGGDPGFAQVFVEACRRMR